MNDRQLQIIDAAIPLFLTEGVGVSTARIAKAAGVSNGTLFNAFATKQDLIDAIYRLTKTEMFGALTLCRGTFDRAALRQNWDEYLNWARAKPLHPKIMHLLLDAGLASARVKAEIDALIQPYGQALEATFVAGQMRGPNLSYINGLIFFYLDQVISQDLRGAEEDLAFTMLCDSIGLKP